ncbi:MAG TPA: TauD/TfdA family dioxygenase, partial [Rhizomicrobium sp.]
GEDGATVFLDGFALAEWLRDSHPQDFARLARCAVPFTFTDSAGRRYAARSPVLRTAADGALTGLRCNHRSLGAVDFDAAETALWYEAYLTFMLAADAPERQLSVVLRPGDIAIFDNERILHGRRPFIAAAERLLKGCYADRDALRATLARLDQACDGSSRSR